MLLSTCYQHPHPHVFSCNPPLESTDQFKLLPRHNSVTTTNSQCVVLMSVQRRRRCDAGLTLRQHRVKEGVVFADGMRCLFIYTLKFSRFIIWRWRSAITTFKLSILQTNTFKSCKYEMSSTLWHINTAVSVCVEWKLPTYVWSVDKR